MTKQANPQSLKRSQESLAALFSEGAVKADLLFIKSSTDVGVERNGGRNGARLAPQSFLAYFKKQTIHGSWSNRRLAEVEVGDEVSERNNFADAQLKEAEKISSLLNSSEHICHLGGGHDHAFPLLKALEKKYQRIIVINVDAHADTRIDADPNSGTPFRQFADSTKAEFHLFQVGLHPFANAESTLRPFKNGHYQVLWRSEVNEAGLRNLYEKISALLVPQTAVVFSLDADALDGGVLPGVSAVNGAGLSLAELHLIWNTYTKLKLPHSKLLGIYELNPVYDTVSSLSVRTLSNFVFEAFK